MSKEDFQILSARDHCRTRPGMYLGSTAKESVERFVMGKWQTVEYVPALNKMIDEIIDNSIDEAIRTNFEYANMISVKIDNGLITIEDNGRGIPQEEVLTPEGDKLLRPVAAWTKTNAGTSFDDDRTTIGANGVGSACTNFLSSKFIGNTWQNGQVIKVVCTNGCETTKVSTSAKAGSGTLVSFVPDYSLLSISSLYDVHTVELVEDRLTSLQVAFPEIKFKFNGKLVKSSTIKKYSELFKTDPNQSVVISTTDNLSYFVTSSEDGYRTTSYINGVNTRLGGTYTDYVSMCITDELVSMIKKRYKIDIAKATIRSGLSFVLFARNFKNPKYDSQTKERLTSNITDVKAHYDSCGSDVFVKIARKIMSSEDVIGPIIEAQLAKKLAADNRAATLAQKKLKKIKVAKHIAATTTNSTLFLCEGDSAIGFLLKVRNPKTVGGYPLRGVVMNTWDMKPADVLKNKELSELIAVLGLDINDPDSVDNLAYDKVATLTDADHDGNHIAALLIAFFYKFWPRLFTEKRIHMTRTPILISNKGKAADKWFYSYTDAKKFKESSAGYHHRYIKGLASLTEDEYYKIINEPVLAQIKIDNANWFQVMMGSDSSPRKEWLTDQTPSIL